jgi:Bacterial capsule synthesis protein PGA_cap
MTAKPIRIIAVGDLSLNGRYQGLLQRRGVEHPFQLVLPAWHGADLLLGNLESAVTTAPKAFWPKLTLRSAPLAVAALRTAGFDCLTLANNHLMDYGPQGLADTQAALDAAGIRHAGAGKDAAAASAPVLLHRSGQTIGVLAFCLVEQKSPLYAGPANPGVALFSVEEAVRSIQELRPRVDWLIVQVHWGVEMARLPAPEQREWAGRMAAAGADLIVGHHPHVVQPCETIAGVPVYYSLGNFLFSDMYWRGRSHEGRPFLSKFRMHPLSRRTGWAEVVLTRGQPAVARFHPARLRRDLAVQPEATTHRLQDWKTLCSGLQHRDYLDRAQEEMQRARARIEWGAAWKPLQRRIEMKMLGYGLLPFAVLGD